MALPRQLKNGLSPREIEFLAENEMIEIAPAIDTRQDLELLAAFLKQEEDEPRFSELPYHFIETAQLLLENACDDIPSADAVRTLIKNLREARQSKARLGVAQLGQDYLQMDNIGLMEINEIRPFFTKAFYEIHTLDQTRETMDPDRPLDLGYRGYDDDTEQHRNKR
ncbi:DNA replication protein psf2 [Podila horticola]|nr:DNA replication protein psf2 [Podila horticola]